LLVFLLVSYEPQQERYQHAQRHPCTHHQALPKVYALQYDVVTDFEPIALLADAPMLLIVNKAIPASNLNEFIAWLRANPDKAIFGTAGAGSPPHLLGVLLQKETGTQFKLVHYRGGTPAMQDIVGGHIDGIFISVTAALPQMVSGTVKALGVTAKKAHTGSARNPDNGRGGIARILFLDMGGAVCP